jgi:hypothetical protein
MLFSKQYRLDKSNLLWEIKNDMDKLKVASTFTKLCRLLILLSLVGCVSNNKNSGMSATLISSNTPSNDIAFSFVFVGCNRVDRGDVHNVGPSTANEYALTRIISEVASLPNKPDVFFFLGDLVVGESTNDAVNQQLTAWNGLFDSITAKHPLTGTEFVAVPGNHEMLAWVQSANGEFPLAGSTDIWMNQLSSYMPTDRTKIVGDAADVNQMTFSFVRGNVAFIVMNTDTYNPPSNGHPNGQESVTPTGWIVAQVQQYRALASIGHIFVLGHKPIYIDNKLAEGHDGLLDGTELWDAFKANNVNSVLSAHKHYYARMHPDGSDGGPHQVIAGNAGSPASGSSPHFYGFTEISVTTNGDVQLNSHGFDIGTPYYTAPNPETATTVRDAAVLNWTGSN